MKKLKRIVLTNAHNFRDLGGYMTADNKMTRWHRIYRSDSLHNLTEDEWNFLYVNGVRNVVDLRGKAEADENKINCPDGIKYQNCPAKSGNTKLDLDKLSKLDLASSMIKTYVEIFTEDISLIVKALSAIINSLDSGSVVYMCSAGKDRTGIISAIILYLSKVNYEDIVADYKISYTLNEKGINAYLRTLTSVKLNENNIGSNPERIIPLLNLFKDINLEKFLIKNGLDKVLIEKLRDFFVES